MKRRAFTLMELLVVIGIIAVLLGLLMPGLRSAREIGHRTACASNLQHLGVAMLLYARENSELYPFAAGVDERGEYDADWIYWQGDCNVPPITIRDSSSPGHFFSCRYRYSGAF